MFMLSNFNKEFSFSSNAFVIVTWEKPVQLFLSLGRLTV